MAFLVLSTAIPMDSASAQELVDPKIHQAEPGPQPVDPKIHQNLPLLPGGASYWGVIPPPADSLRFAFQPRPKPGWEKALYAPYAVIKFPFALLLAGTRAGTLFLDEANVFSRLRRLTHPFPLPAGFSGKIAGGGVSGLGVGLDFSHGNLPVEGDSLLLTARVSVMQILAQKYTLTSQLRTQKRTRIVLGGGFSRRPELDYYGRGPETKSDQEAAFDRQLAWGGLGLNWRVGNSLRLSLSSIVSSAYTTSSSEGEPSIPDLFEIIPPGYGGHSRGLAAGVSMTHNSSAADGRPDGGGVQSLDVTHFWESTAGLADFWSFRVDIQHFFGLWNSGQTLALRGVSGWLESDRPEAIAFVRLYDNDNPDRIRAFEPQRWRDRGILIGTVEYRWPVWANTTARGLGLDLSLFSDVGQVFPEFEAIGGDHMQFTYGGGLRLINSEGGFSVSVEIARSDEGSRFQFQFDQNFQRVAWGFIHGSDHVALR